MVPLGSECQDFALECVDGMQGPPGSELDAGSPNDLDASQGAPEAGRDAGSGPVADAGPAEDADGPDAGAPAFPGIRNATFTITSEPPEPGDVGLLGDADIDPWRWCAGSIAVGHELGGYAPSDGDSLISLAFGAGPALLGQLLSEPLEPLREYAIALDAARSEGGSDELRLELLGTELTCTSPSTLASTPALTAGDTLTTYCLRFTPLERHSHLTLRVAPLSSVVGTVYVDNLRQVSDCP
jgi:hypothetical protein